MRLFLSIALLLASVASDIPTTHAAVVPDATVFLLPGEQAEDAPSGVVFDELFSNPALNNDGKVAFHALLEGDGIDFENRGGVWSNSSDSLALVARTNNPAPGLPGDVVFQNFLSDILLNNAGDVAFLGVLTAETPEQNSIWSGGSGAEIALIARDGQQAPGMPIGVSFFGFESLRLNSAGQVAFSSGLRGSGINGTNDQAIWSDKQGALTAIARNGEQAPGLPPGLNFAHFGVFDGLVPEISFNSRGQTAFLAGISGLGSSEFYNGSVWSEASGRLAFVALAGDHAPGVSAEAKFERFGSPVLNSQGHTAFRATITGPNIDRSNNTGIWIQRDDVLAMVVQTGDPAPGLSSDVRFGSLFSDTSDNFFAPAINSTGDIVFRAILTGVGGDRNHDISIWAGSSDELRLLARTGDHAPGLPDGVIFSGFDSPVLNDAGQTAFRGFVVGEGIDSSNDIGIWAQDRSGEFQLIARGGDMLEVSPGQFVQIGAPSFAARSNEPHESSGFNDRGQLAVNAGGIGFISNRVAVPEPPRQAFAAIASVLFCMLTPSRLKLGIRSQRR